MFPERPEFGFFEPLSRQDQDKEYQAYILRLRREIGSYMFEEGKFVFYSSRGFNAMCYTVKRMTNEEKPREYFDFNIQAIVPPGYPPGFVNTPFYWGWKYDVMLEIYNKLRVILFPKIKDARNVVEGLMKYKQPPPEPKESLPAALDFAEVVGQAVDNIYRFDQSSSVGLYGSTMIMGSRGDTGFTTTSSESAITALTTAVGDLVKVITPIVAEKSSQVPALSASENRKPHKWTPRLKQKKDLRHKRKQQ